MSFNPDLQRQIESDRYDDDEPDLADEPPTLSALEEHLVEIKSGIQGTQVLIIVVAILLACLAFWR